MVDLEFEKGGLLSEQLLICLSFEECIQYLQTGLKSTSQANTFTEKITQQRNNSISEN